MRFCQHVADDGWPPFGIHLCWIFFSEANLGPHSFREDSFRHRKVRASCINPHVIVKTSISMKLGSQVTRPIGTRLQHYCTCSISKNGCCLLILPVKKLADSVRANYQNILVVAVGNDEL